MKSYTNLYERVFSFENLLLSAREARKGKRYRDYAIKFYLNLEKNLLSLQNDLLAKTYSLGSYREFYIKEPKKRLISAAPYRDRVIHHALCNVIEPLFEPGFIYDAESFYKNGRNKDNAFLSRRNLRNNQGISFRKEVKAKWQRDLLVRRQGGIR